MLKTGHQQKGLRNDEIREYDKLLIKKQDAIIQAIEALAVNKPNEPNSRSPDFKGQVEDLTRAAVDNQFEDRIDEDCEFNDELQSYDWLQHPQWKKLEEFARALNQGKKHL